MSSDRWIQIKLRYISAESMGSNQSLSAREGATTKCNKTMNVLKLLLREQFVEPQDLMQCLSRLAERDPWVEEQYAGKTDELSMTSTHCSSTFPVPRRILQKIKVESFICHEVQLKTISDLVILNWVVPWWICFQKNHNVPSMPSPVGRETRTYDWKWWCDTELH